MTGPLIVGGAGHVRAGADGTVTVRLRAAGDDERPWRGTVVLESARRVPSRWLTRGRPRRVRFGSAPFELRDGAATVTVRLAPDKLALLRRVQTIQVAVRATSCEGERVRTAGSRLLRLHAPARRRRVPPR